MKTLLHTLGITVAATLATSAIATQPFALTPRTPTGFSAIEQRHVYAPPGEGEFEFPLRLGLGAPNELMIREPSMCEGSAKIKVRYSKAENVVEITGEFHGLPYRMSATRPTDLSTPYNQFPLSVEDGVWQMWLVARSFSTESIFYYDPATLQLIANEYDLPQGPPPGAIPVKLPVMHMIASPLFEGNEGGQAHVTFRFRYDRILDEQGKGGVYFAFAPYNLCKPDEYGPYYTQGGLPTELAPSFDRILESIWGGYGFSIATSLEPRVKPAYLLSRDNPMIGWTGSYPASLPDGVEVDPVNGVVRLATSCQTGLNDPYTQARYNLCGGF